MKVKSGIKSSGKRNYIMMIPGIAAQDTSELSIKLDLVDGMEECIAEKRMYPIDIREKTRD